MTGSLLLLEKQDQYGYAAIEIHMLLDCEPPLPDVDSRIWIHTLVGKIQDMIHGCCGEGVAGSAAM
jgi:hypothetical protein